MRINFFFFSLLFLMSCNKTLKVKTDATFTNITASSAKVNVTGSVTNSAKKFIWGFAYDTSIVVNVPGMHYEHPGLSKRADFSTTLNGLSPATTYYVRPYLMHDGMYYLYKEIPSFTTDN